MRDINELVASCQQQQSTDRQNSLVTNSSSQNPTMSVYHTVTYYSSVLDSFFLELSKR